MTVLGLGDMKITQGQGQGQGLLGVEVAVGVIERTATMMVDMREVRSEEIVNVSMSITLWLHLPL
jgi:hypothetical protein